MAENKEKVTNKNVAIALSAVQNIYIPTKVEIKDSKEYVSFGKNNKYPQECYSYYQNCSTLKSIVDTTSDFILGNGVEAPDDFINSKGEDLEVIIKKIGIQYLIYNGYAIKVIRDAKLKLIDLLVMDFKQCRVDKDMTKVFVSDKWGSYGSNKADVYDIYNLKKNESIYIYNGILNDDEVYPTPRYAAVFQSIETEIAIQNYHLTSIKKGFRGGYIINFNNGDDPTEDQKTDIKKKIDEFTSEFGREVMITFSNSKENQTTVNKIPENDFDSKYTLTSKSVMNNIFGAFSCQPLLVGRTNENIGFNTQEFSEAMKLFNRTVVLPYQKQIIKSLNFIGIENIIIKPFSLEYDEEVSITDNTNTDTSSDNSIGFKANK